MAVDHNNPQSRDEEILIATIDGKEYDKAPQSRMEELLLELKETIEEGGGGGGTTNYNNLSNQPQVNGETLIGDKTGAELGLVDAEEGKGLSTNDYDDTEKAAVAAATSAISAIKDGTDIDSFGDVEVALLDKADTSDLGTAAAKDSTNVVTSGSTDLVESGAVKDAIDAAVAAAYHHAGTKTVAQLTHDLLIAANEGNVYNITDSGTTTSDFIEGIGKTIDEGSNVGICKVGNTYMFDLLSGFVDTTNFVQKSLTAGLLKNDGTVNDEIEGDVDSLKSGLTNLDNEVNGDATTYPYADVITIEDAVPANLADCNVKIEPVQNLHGYDHPWVGGAGKNKQNIGASVTTEEVNGITYTITRNSSDAVIEIDLDGTASSNSYKSLGSTTLPTGGYIVNGVNGGSTSTYYIDYSFGGSIVKSYNGDATMKLNSDASVSAFINVVNGVTLNHVKIYPMIRLATETDATFAPYTNICPITGHTEASVQRDGKNLFDESSVTNGKVINFQTGRLTTNASYYTSDYIPVVSGDKYTFSGVCHITSAEKWWYDENKQPLQSANNLATKTVPNGAYYFRFSNKISEGYVGQIEKGQTATPYVPYAGQTYTIALGDTIYGGTVDFDSGVMTVDRVCVDADTLEWQKHSTISNNVYITDESATIKPSPNDTASAKDICSDYETKAWDALFLNYAVGFGVSRTGRFAIANPSITTLSDFETSIADTQICYELATPTTIQLTPTQIQLLKGQNTLTASTGQISVTVNGVSGAIGQVQSEVNELAESVVDRFDNVIGWSENKNLLPMTLENLKIANKNEGGSWNGNVYTHRNVSYEILFDENGAVSAINANGTPTAGSNSVLYVLYSSNLLSENKYIGSLGTSIKGSSSSFAMIKLNSSWGEQQTIYEETEITGNIARVRLQVYDGYTANNLLFHPMIRKSNVGSSMYEPYHEVIGKSVNTLLDRVPTAPTTDGTYNLQVTVSSGTPTYSWESAT